jgi:peroxiredoxin
VRDRCNEFGDAALAVITFGAPERAAAYQQELLAPLPVLVDQDRSTYQAYGLGRGGIWSVWGPRTWRAYARLIVRGRRFHRPTDDTLQLGGDFVIGRDGRVLYAFRSADPDDRPTVDTLIAAAARA